MKGSQKRKRFFKPLEAGPGQLPPTIGHTHHTKVFALQKNFTTQHHLLVPHPKRGGMKEELDERSDLKGTRKVFFFFSFFLNGSSIFREATSPFDRATTFFNCGDNFCFFLFLWENGGGMKNRHAHKLYTTATTTQDMSSCGHKRVVAICCLLTC